MKSRIKGFTLIEILVVVMIMASLVAVGGGLSASFLDYYKVRGAAETLVWQLRSVRSLTMSRGGVETNAGLYVFPERIRADKTAAEGPGFSYFVWFEQYGRNPPGAGATLASLSAADRALVENFPRGVRLVSDGTAADGNPVNLTEINSSTNLLTFQFDRWGVRQNPIPRPSQANGSVDFIIDGQDRVFRVTCWGRPAPLGGEITGQTYPTMLVF